MREPGIYISAVLATAAGALGILWLGMTGMVWNDGQLVQTAGYDSSEASIGKGALTLFWGVGAALVVAVFSSSLRQARLVPERKVYFHRLAWILPLIVVGMVVLLWPIMLDPGGASLAP